MEDERLPILQEVVRELFPGVGYRVSRVAEGVSTWVYCLQRDGERLYLRVLPEEGASFAPEVAAHCALRDAGVRVPEVIAWEACHPALGRSIMVTTAIPGRDLRSYASPADRAIIREAGRDLARINQVMVAGYGWVKRDTPFSEMIHGEHPSLQDWFAADVEPMLAKLAASTLLHLHEVNALALLQEQAVARFSTASHAILVHGDFDLTHVFATDGMYTGIIDFGEIRGAYPLYDLGHFAIEQEEFVPDLLAGYADITSLSPDDIDAVSVGMVLIAARRAGIWLSRGRNAFPPDLAAIRRGLATLRAV